MAIIILRRGPTAIFRDGIKKEHKQKLQTVYDQDLLWVLPNHMVIRDSPRCRVVLDCLQTMPLENMTMGRARIETPHTVFNKEHSKVRTTCLSGQVVMYVMAFTPCTGSVARYVSVGIVPFGGQSYWVAYTSPFRSM